MYGVNLTHCAVDQVGMLLLDKSLLWHAFAVSKAVHRILCFGSSPGGERMHLGLHIDKVLINDQFCSAVLTTAILITPLKVATLCALGDFPKLARQCGFGGSAFRHHPSKYHTCNLTQVMRPEHVVQAMVDCRLKHSRRLQVCKERARQ